MAPWSKSRPKSLSSDLNLRAERSGARCFHQVLNPPHNVSDHDPVCAGGICLGSTLCHYVILREFYQAGRYAFFEVECMAIHPRSLTGSKNHCDKGCAAVPRRLGTLAREVRSATKEPRQGKRSDSSS